jgi:hypothetical protein
MHACLLESPGADAPGAHNTYWDALWRPCTPASFGRPVSFTARGLANHCLAQWNQFS